MPYMDKVAECQHLRNSKQCVYHTNLKQQNSVEIESKFTKGITDIEDLLRLGTVHESCPYYIAKERATRVKVIFIPYNVSCADIFTIYLENLVDLPLVIYPFYVDS